MQLQFIPATTLYLISAIIALSLAYVTWRMKPKDATTWIILLVFMAIWAMGGLIESFLTDLEQKAFVITTITYLGVVGVICFWCFFTIIYSNHRQWLNKYTIILLAFIPVAHYIIINTNQYHQLFWTNITLIEQGGFVFFKADRGPWFWLWFAYAYIVVILGSLLLSSSVIRSPKVYKGQTSMLVLGALFPLIANAFYFLGVNPIAPLDLSPVSFVITGILITIGMLRFSLFKLTPIAYDLIFKGVSSGVLIFDLKNKIIDINPIAESILNYSKDDIIGRDIGSVLPNYSHIIQQFQETTEAHVEISLGSLPSVYEVQMMPLTNRRGKLNGRILLLYDITKRKRAAEERDKLIDELDAYASTVAHDLKNPLAIITGHVALVEKRGQDSFSPKIQYSLGVVSKTGFQMAQIIDSLLLLASVRNVEEIKTSPLDTPTMIDDVWRRLTNLAEQANAELVRPERWPSAIGYAPWIEEVWTNYLSNAIKYGGDPPRIEIGADVFGVESNGDTPQVRFWVHDNGPGISDAERKQLFQEFSRLDQHSKLQGHGLGLSIVKRILDKLGGTFGVESLPDQGSTFFFTLPMDLESTTHNQISSEKLASH